MSSQEQRTYKERGRALTTHQESTTQGSMSEQTAPPSPSSPRRVRRAVSCKIPTMSDGILNNWEQSQRSIVSTCPRSPPKRQGVRRLRSDRSERSERSAGGSLSSLDLRSPRRLMRPSTPQRQKRVAQLKQKKMQDLPFGSTKNELLDCKTLKGIATHKSTIALMRPSRRKIRWNTAAVSDLPHYSNKSPRISGLQLDDLSLHASASLRSSSSELEESASSLLLSQEAQAVDKYTGKDIDLLERRINLCMQCIARVEWQVDEDKEAVGKLKVDNEALREELLNMPDPPSQPSMRLKTNKQLASTIEMLQENLAKVNMELSQCGGENKEGVVEKLIPSCLEKSAKLQPQGVTITNRTLRAFPPPPPIPTAE